MSNRSLANMKTIDISTNLNPYINTDRAITLGDIMLNNKDAIDAVLSTFNYTENEKLLIINHVHFLFTSPAQQSMLDEETQKIHKIYDLYSEGIKALYWAIPTIINNANLAHEHILSNYHDEGMKNGQALISDEMQKEVSAITGLGLQAEEKRSIELTKGLTLQEDADLKKAIEESLISKSLEEESTKNLFSQTELSGSEYYMQEENAIRNLSDAQLAKALGEAWHNDSSLDFYDFS